MGWSRSLSQVLLIAILLVGMAWSRFALGAEMVPPNDRMLYTRMNAAKRVTVQRISGVPSDSCRPAFVTPSDTIACYPASYVVRAPKGEWVRDLLDLSARWSWMRGRSALSPEFAAAVGVHFRGDSLDADWILSFEPMSVLIRINGIPVASATIPTEHHAPLLNLVQASLQKDALVVAQRDLEEERHSAARHVDRSTYGGCDCWIEALFKSPYKRVAGPHDTTGCYAKPPVPTGTRRPIYPEFAKEALIQGTVILHALISADGTISNIRVFRGITGLNDAAVDAVRRWTFEPATKEGQPICTWIEVAVEFHLAE